MTFLVEDTLTSPAFMQRVSEAELQRLDALVGRQRRFAFAWGGQSASLRFTLLETAPAANLYLRLRIDDHSFDLGLPALPEPSLFDAAFAGIEIAELPDELILGVLEAWLEEPAQALQAQSIALQLEGLHRQSSAHHAGFGWELHLGDQRALHGVVLGETGALNHLANLAGRVAPQAVHSADVLPIALRVIVASLRLPLSALAGLQAGDVFFPPLTSAARAAGDCELWHRDAALAQARLRPNAVEIRSMKTSAEPPPAASAATIRVDDLPVTATFEVGQLDVTVGHLRTVGVGHTFELPAEPGRLVTIRVNGREVGHGELVDCGDKVGVRIAAWNLS